MLCAHLETMRVQFSAAFLSIFGIGCSMGSAPAANGNILPALGGKAPQSAAAPVVKTPKKDATETDVPAVRERAELPLERIRLPEGFKIQIYASGVVGARSLALSPANVLYVGTLDSKVYALPNADRDATADRVFELTSDLDAPNGVAVHGGALYVAELSRVLRFDDVDRHFSDAPSPVVVTDRFPSATHHGWKFIAVGPDNRLYVPVGAPCNVCTSEDPRFASITRIGLDGRGLEIIARGVRNTVGFDWHPVTRELWFTENGRDGMGDDVPPDELNRLSQVGADFGFPRCHGTLPDPEYGRERGCEGSENPAALLGPHVAALGMRFYTGAMFPAEYRNQIFIAEHGSWDRSENIGFRVTLVRLDGNRVTSYEPFAEGWLEGEKAWGRPVDLLVAPDGALLVSDDGAGVIYRISYG